MSDSPPVFGELRRLGFDLRFTYHADSIFRDAFPEPGRELEEALLAVRIPVRELIAGGGGEARLTQRLRRDLASRGWEKATFRVEKRINDRITLSQSHEIDHVRASPKGDVALEIEWNNKDPFFDRDLENFSRLHADGGISVGVIVTRGESLHRGMAGVIRRFAEAHGIHSFEDAARFEVRPTPRQREAVRRDRERDGKSFIEAWPARFTADKFGAATTHWAKLMARIERGVGNPCPIVGIGIPLGVVVQGEG